MSRYLLSKSAANDLEVIWDYIAQDDEQAASRWIARLLEACEMLAKSPGIGHHRQDLTRLPVLFWPVGAYLIAYRRQMESIEIVAVTQGARDIPTFMSQRIE
jgi:antitoxin ParD1/3/4/toxin ParE1/3/4